MSALPELPDTDGSFKYHSFSAVEAYGDARAAHARKAALEEAAKLCDRIGDNHDAPMCDVAWECEDAIKELLK